MQSKTTETAPFSRRCFSTPSRWEFFCSVTQHYSYQRQMFSRLLERLAVNYFELFESLNFETVQDLKIWIEKKGLIKSNECF